MKEVLKSVRKHGMYVTDDLLNDPDLLLKTVTRLKQEHDLWIALEAQQVIDKPKVEVYEKVISSEGTLTTTQIAKEYGLTAQVFNKLLNELHVQYKQGSMWVLYSERANNGYTKMSTFVDEGSNQAFSATKWTQKGRAWLYQLLKDNNLRPVSYEKIEQPTTPTFTIL